MKGGKKSKRKNNVKTLKGGEGIPTCITEQNDPISRVLMVAGWAVPACGMARAAEAGLVCAEGAEQTTCLRHAGTL